MVFFIYLGQHMCGIQSHNAGVAQCLQFRVSSQTAKKYRRPPAASLAMPKNLILGKINYIKRDLLSYSVVKSDIVPRIGMSMSLVKPRKIEVELTLAGMPERARFHIATLRLSHRSYLLSFSCPFSR